MASVLDKIINELQVNKYIDVNGEYNEWEKIGRWMEDNESGWPGGVGDRLAWNYIEATIEAQVENADTQELLDLMKEAYNDSNFSLRFPHSIVNEEDIDFVDLDLLMDYILSLIKTKAGSDYFKYLHMDFAIDLEGKRLFYNPIWMPEYEDIQILGCYIPLDAEISGVDALLDHLRSRYISIASEAYREDRGYVLDNFGKFIDEEYPNGNPESMVDYLLQSSKFRKHLDLLERRIEENQLPPHIIGSDEIELETDFVELLALIAANGKP